jgi:NADH-quinone oxidoreductase subunit N
MVIAALLAWIPKAIGFIAIIRTLATVISVRGASDPLVQKAMVICWVIAAVTMTLGNTVALLQDNLKRLLAYSSIAHAGYLMIGVTVAFANGSDSRALYLGSEGIFFYLVAYALMTLGTFARIPAAVVPAPP